MGILVVVVLAIPGLLQGLFHPFLNLWARGWASRALY
jgi:hypothetical protein